LGEIAASSAATTFYYDDPDDYWYENVGFLNDLVDDLDGDGLADVLIGSPDNKIGGSDAGAVWVVRGEPDGALSGAFDLVDADATWIGGTTWASAGQGTAGAGDVDGDGLDDVIVGAWGALDFRGAAYLVSGTVTGTHELSDATAILIGEEAGWLGADGDWNMGSCAGFNVASAGDVNGDGFADLLVTTNSTFSSYLVFGPVTGEISLSEANGSFDLPSMPVLGTNVSRGADLNGDGFDDIV